MRECHFLAKVCKTPVGTSKKRMLLPLEFYALLIFWCFFFSFCVLKFMFPRVRFGLPAAILTQNAFSSKKSSNKTSFPSPLYSKKCFLALPRVWGSFWNWIFCLRAEQNVALARAWGPSFTESAPIPSESIIEKVALPRIWRTLRNCRCAFFFIRLCFFP